MSIFEKSAWRTSALILLALLEAFSMFGQTSTTGRVVGTVSDATGAVVPKAEVELLNTATNVAQNAITDDTGGYVFANVTPGIYKLTVKMQGFRTATVTNLAVEVNKSNDVPVKLEVGGDKEIVEVTATAAAALQTTDAQIGNALSTDNILRLPTLQRNAVELMNLQPGVVAGGTGLNMRVSGAIDDQNTVSLDGIDITSNLVASNTSIPTPADSVEEFRANVANPTASMSRGSGGQIALIGRRGGNEYHWALYEYLQNNDLNSNTWDNNRAGQPTAIIHDNRYGGRIGGAIKKNKTFFFDNYEARRFNSVYQTNRTVPTATLKQGIIQFNGPTGLEQFNLNGSLNICGAAGNSACDPRGLGLNKSVAAQWAQMPLPNLPGIGDGLNTSGYFVNVGVPTQTDYGVMRLDHIFNEKFTFNGSFTYWRVDQVGNAGACGDVSLLGNQASCAISAPQRTMVPTAQVTWQISPTLINVFRAGWVRDTSQSNATPPSKGAGILNTPGSQTSAGPIALLIGSGVSSFIDSPIDMDTQRARYQANYSQDRQLMDDMTKIKGSHTIQFGTAINQLPYTHVRADKVVGSITSLVAAVDAGSFLSIPAVNQPLTCTTSLTTNCIRATDLTNYNRYYASVLGLIDNVNVLAMRDANLNPLPLGTNLVNRTNEYATYFYLQDSWRIRPTLTLTYGLSYGWQTSPTEAHNLQTVQIDATTGQLINPITYLNTKMQSALAGTVYTPTVGYEPVSQAHVPGYNIDWGDVAPRASFAWNPSLRSGPLGRIFGDRKTVLRGGFAIVYDRSNTVQAVEIPMLGVGF